ncbi:MAG: hypothetical protein ACRELF_01970, partial [Gemmataceae bacterium]
LRADAVRFSTATQDGYRYLMLRYRPELPGAAKRQRRDWVFLFESSAERDPLLARTQIEIVRTLLANAEHDDTFAILTADTQVHAFAPSPLRATPENVAVALAFLEKAHLLGALDLDAGLTTAAQLLNNSEHPVLVHLGCGQPILGERRADVLADRLPRQACYVGVGVGKRGASAFMRRAAERCQGYVTKINPDEPVAWRAFDLLATLNTPRLLGVRVADIDGKTRFLCPTSTEAQGEELCAITRLSADAPLPSSVCVTGTLDGQPFREVLGVDSPRPDAAYLPRTWARLEIDRLLGEDAVKNKNAIIALSKAMYVMTPYTSLLVLENEAMYAQYKVDRGRKDHWAMYPCPPKIPVVSEWPPEPWEQPHYIIQLEVPPIMRAASSVESEAQLKERIRQENRERQISPYINILRGGASPGIDWSAIIPQQQGPRDGSGSDSIRSGSGDAPVGVGMSTLWMMNPYQGYLSGAADISRAQANYFQGIQQAKLVYQNAIRSSLETRRTFIEETEWERDHMPDPEKIRQKTLERELDRYRHSLSPTDIWSARSLNALLRHLIAQQKEGARGPNVPLSDEILAHVNLTVGGDVSLLMDNGNLKWPECLQRGDFKKDRDNLSKLMKTAFQRVKSNEKPEDATLKDSQFSLRKLKDSLNNNVDSFTPDEFIEAARYLRCVKNTITALKNPNFANVFNGTWKPTGRSVAELVRFMGDKGLWFAPATPKDEAAYVALYHALTAFDAGLPRSNATTNPLGGYATLRVENFDPEGAERLLAALLADPKEAKQPALWRQAARLAERRKQYDSALQRLWRALELDRRRPLSLTSLRRDNGWFLELARQRAQKLAARHRSVPRELLDRVMAVADEWRAVDVEDWRPCWLAGRVLSLAGERELAWSYLTSPSILRQGDARVWIELARQQHGQDEYDLADRAFVVAASLEPTNAEIVWERILNHRAAGRRDAARTLLRQLDKGTWAERYRGFQLRARRALEEERGDDASANCP